MEKTKEKMQKHLCSAALHAVSPEMGKTVMHRTTIKIVGGPSFLIGTS